MKSYTTPTGAVQATAAEGGSKPQKGETRRVDQEDEQSKGVTGKQQQEGEGERSTNVSSQLHQLEEDAAHTEFAKEGRGGSESKRQKASTVARPRCDGERQREVQRVRG